MKIKYRLLLSYGFLVLLAFTIVGLNLATFRTMESDSSFVNYSGKLRMTSYKMAQISNVFINSKNPKLGSELKKSMEEYELLLTSLDDGNKEFGLSKLTDGATMDKMKNIEELWYTRYKSAYNEILLNYDANALMVINDEIGGYVDSINEMVTAYSKSASEKVSSAKMMNNIIILVAINVAFFSYAIINKGIHKPIATLVGSLKDSSFDDNDGVRKNHELSKDEITEMKGYFDELIYDSLTKAYNRRSGLAKLNRMLQNDDKGHLTVSLCFIDINGLKQVNDVLGHKYGDELIITAISVIREIIRDYDFIIRLGGDEFLIVFNHTNEEKAESIWSRVLKAYNDINQKENRSYIISVSHGIIEYKNLETIKINELIKEADDKMYAEKRAIKDELGYNVIR